jgi:CheY-like chemotaxis protein
MRPKKKILIVDVNEERLSTRRFLLTNKGYAVSSASSRAEALAVASGIDPALAIVVLPLPDAAQLLADLRAHAPFTHTLVLAENAKEHPGLFADMTLWGKPPVAELLDRIAIAAACKRGPKKVPPAPVPAKQDVITAQHWSCAGNVGLTDRRVA